MCLFEMFGYLLDNTWVGMQHQLLSHGSDLLKKNHPSLKVQWVSTCANEAKFAADPNTCQIASHL